MLPADAIRMLADGLIVSVRERLRLRGRRKKSVEWNRFRMSKSRNFFYWIVGVCGCFWPTNFYEKSEIFTNKMKNLRSAWADDWSNGIKKSRPTSVGEARREKL